MISSKYHAETTGETTLHHGSRFGFEGFVLAIACGVQRHKKLWLALNWKPESEHWVTEEEELAKFFRVLLTMV